MSNVRGTGAHGRRRRVSDRLAVIVTSFALVGAAACGATTAGSASEAPSSGGPSGGTPTPTTTVTLRNVDVTVIYPLPRASQIDALLAPSSVGRGGPLVGKDVFDKGNVPELDESAGLPDDDARLAAMRVVALRYDPCAGVTMPPKDSAGCVPQLRLVFQSLDASSASTRARDGALHAFYRLDRTAAAEIEEQLRSMRAGRASDPEMPLGVHPRLAEEGPAGPYGSALRSLVLAHAGPENLVRVTTFSRIANAHFDWKFAIRERSAAGFTDGSIATIGKNSQIVRTISGGRLDADFDPPSGSPDDPTRLFKVSSGEQPSAFKATAKVLNPRTHSSESVDCGPCHVAPDVAVFAEQALMLPLDPDTRFVTSYPLAATAKPVEDAFGLKNLHMLSYLDRTLNVSARSANETAAILEYLNAR